MFINITIIDAIINEVTVIVVFIDKRFKLVFACKKALDLNGGVDAHRFELFVTKFIKYLFTPNVTKICSMIEKLGITA